MVLNNFTSYRIRQEVLGVVGRIFFKNTTHVSGSVNFYISPYYNSLIFLLIHLGIKWVYRYLIQRIRKCVEQEIQEMQEMVSRVLWIEVKHEFKVAYACTVQVLHKATFYSYLLELLHVLSECKGLLRMVGLLGSGCHKGHMIRSAF